MAIINANTIIPEFSQADLQGFAETGVNLEGLQYRNHFPLQFIPSMDWANVEGDKNPFVMADIVAWGSRAPRKGREFLQSIKGELPKMEVARDMDERDLYTVEQLRLAVQRNPRNQGVANSFIDAIYGDVRFTINSINATLEGISQALVSTGKYKTVLDTNALGVTEVEFDFSIASQGVTKTWSTLVDGDDPLEDIRTIQEAAVSNGYRYRYMFVQRKTLNRLLKSKDVAAFASGVTLESGAAYVLPNINSLNQRLSDHGLPIFVIWEAFVQREKKDGDRDVKDMWEDGNIMFSQDMQIGNIQYTTTREFTLNFGETMAKTITDGMILTTMYGKQDPLTVSTKSTAFALPVLDNASKKLILTTETAK